MTSTAASSKLPVDRRRLRTERGRDLVVDALLSLYDDGDPQPGAALIAARAGVSERTVFRYFDDLESLVGAAIARHVDRIMPIFTSPPLGGDLNQRIAALVKQRLHIYEATAITNRAAQIFEPRSPTIRSALAFRRALLQDQVAQLFAPELALYRGVGQIELLDALNLATCLETLDILRSTMEVTRSRSAAITTRTLRALLAP